MTAGGATGEAGAVWRPLDLAELERRLVARVPETVMVPARVLRRVIKHEHGGGIAHRVPHRKVLAIARERLLAIVDADELALAKGRSLADTVILLPHPLPAQLEGALAGQVLIKYWRLLYHARVHLALEALAAKGKIGPAQVRARLDRIGQTQYDEIRAVLTQEGFLLEPGAPWPTYVEIAAVFLELKAFAPKLVASYFPGVGDSARIEAVIAADVDGAAILADTRPAGAPDPVGAGSRAVQARMAGLLRDARDAGARGNRARAAALMRRAAKLVPAAHAACLDQGVDEHVAEIASGIAGALHGDAAERARWQKALGALVSPAAQDLQGPAARMLADLQRIAIEHPRRVYRLDLAGVILSLGQQPLERELPHQRDVLLVKYLRRAKGRLARAALPEADRALIADLLRSASHRAEEGLRHRCREPIEQAFEAVGLAPENYPEQVARARVIEDLLDRIVVNGHATFSDLRDVLSVSPLKMDDIRDFADARRGTPLLRMDRLLGALLEGIYRPGELYLRGLQRASSLAFATAAGRACTRYLAFPFIGALVTLIIGEEVTEKLLRLEVHLMEPLYFLGLAVFYLGVLHHAGFRGAVLAVLRTAWAAVRGVFRLVGEVLRSRAAIAVWESYPLELIRRHAVRPLVVTAAAVGIAYVSGMNGLNLDLLGVAVLLTTALFFRTRFALHAQEVAADWVGLNWQWLAKDVLPGLFHLVADAFRALLDGLERLLFEIDTLLRYRTGESKRLLWFKAVGALAWSMIAYVVRFCVNLLIEPQINPIKHFPTVTVCHKLLLPMVPHVGGLLAATTGMPRAAANSTAFTGMSMIPGVFGFLVWELSANWQLYAANRAPTIRPLAIGSHGETLLRLMRPGFHSGTLPKAFARLRRAERRRDKRAARKHHEELHHVSETIETFVERELGQLLAKSPGWSAPRPCVGKLELHSNRVELPLTGVFEDAEPLVIRLEEQSGWLLAGVSRAGWLARLSPRQRETLAVALAGLYQLAGVDLVREKLAASLAREPYDICDEGLAVWPGGDYATEVLYGFDRTAVQPPQVQAGEVRPTPPLTVGQLFFLPAGLPWTAWVAYWDADQAGTTPSPPIEPAEVLPAP